MYPYFCFTIISEKHRPRLAQQCVECEFRRYERLREEQYYCHRPLNTECVYKYREQDSSDYDGPCLFPNDW